MTKDQKAMAMAFHYPDARHGGDRKSSLKIKLETEGFNKTLLSQARTVLAVAPIDGALFRKHAAICARLMPVASSASSKELCAALRITGFRSETSFNWPAAFCAPYSLDNQNSNAP
jgi:hypothetical protein